VMKLPPPPPWGPPWPPLKKPWHPRKKHPQREIPQRPPLRARRRKYVSPPRPQRGFELAHSGRHHLHRLRGCGCHRPHRLCVVLVISPLSSTPHHTPEPSVPCHHVTLTVGRYGSCDLVDLFLMEDVCKHCARRRRRNQSDAQQGFVQL
jgi:hypothetical protein